MEMTAHQAAIIDMQEEHEFVLTEDIAVVHEIREISES
jgi:hypothetical protein